MRDRRQDRRSRHRRGGQSSVSSPSGLHPRRAPGRDRDHRDPDRLHPHRRDGGVRTAEERSHPDADHQARGGPQRPARRPAQNRPDPTTPTLPRRRSTPRAVRSRRAHRDTAFGSRCRPVQRAQVIASYDYIKAEMPDVFFVQEQRRTTRQLRGLPFPGTPIDRAWA